MSLIQSEHLCTCHARLSLNRAVDREGESVLFWRLYDHVVCLNGHNSPILTEACSVSTFSAFCTRMIAKLLKLINPVLEFPLAIIALLHLQLQRQKIRFVFADSVFKN